MSLTILAVGAMIGALSFVLPKAATVRQEDK